MIHGKSGKLGLLGDPQWQPTALAQRTVFVDHYGIPAAPGQPGDPQIVDVPELPYLWTATVERWYWDPANQQFWQIPR